VASGIKAQARAPLTAVNAAPWALYEAMADADLPLEASGLRPKYRAREAIPKAACVGEAGTLAAWQSPSTEITASPKGDCCPGKLTAHASHAGTACLSVQGFKAGDKAQAELPDGNKAAIRVGRAAVRVGGSLGMGNAGAVDTTCRKLLHRADGSGYAWRPALPPPAAAGGLKRGRRG
jgi:hypothetical protein